MEPTFDSGLGFFRIFLSDWLKYWEVGVQYFLKSISYSDSSYPQEKLWSKLLKIQTDSQNTASTTKKFSFNIFLTCFEKCRGCIRTQKQNFRNLTEFLKGFIGGFGYKESESKIGFKKYWTPASQCFGQSDGKILKNDKPESKSVPFEFLQFQFWLMPVSILTSSKTWNWRHYSWCTSSYTLLGKVTVTLLHSFYYN